MGGRAGTLGAGGNGRAEVVGDNGSWAPAQRPPTHLPDHPPSPRTQELGVHAFSKLAGALLGGSLRLKPRKPLNPTITAVF